MPSKSVVCSDRELPVVWSVAKGSFVNKLILVPLALLISVVAPWLINPLLMIGGLFLCYEGRKSCAYAAPQKAKTAEGRVKTCNRLKLIWSSLKKKK